jgi:NAD(P)-dependent dehydrogenase (short-subunit alcohol dehydrogenase family)
MSTQHAIIIGGSSGIGLATAARLIELEYRVTIAGRDRERLAAASDALHGAASAVQMDATQVDQVRKLFTTVGTFDHLILAAGSRHGLGAFASVSVSEVRQGFEEKMLSQFATAQAAIAHLNPQGSITFVSAVTAIASMPGTAGIGAQNAAITALVPILAAELRPLRVNTVAPGVIDTPWWDFMPGEQKAAAFAGFAQRALVGRNGTAQDVAQAITFLVANTFVTAQTLVVDGGARLVA